MTPTSIIDASWQLYRKHFRVFILPLALLLIAGAAAVLIGRTPYESPLTIAVVVLAMLVFSWMDGTLLILSANLLEKKSGEVQNALIHSLKILGPLVALSFITQFLISAGLVLLIIPGIALAYLLALSLPDLVLADRGLLASLGQSVRMLAKKNNLRHTILAIAVPWIFWQIVLFLSAGILIMLAGVAARSFPSLDFLASRTAFLFIIILLSSLIRPLILTYLVIVYQSLTHTNANTLTPNDLTPQP